MKQQYTISFMYRFAMFVLVFLFIFTSCSSEVNILGIKAIKQDSSSRELKYRPAKHPIIYIGNIAETEYRIYLREALINAQKCTFLVISDSSGVLKEKKINDSSVTTSYFLIDKSGKIYEKKEYENACGSWVFILTCQNGKGYMIWNTENGGENVAFVSSRGNFVYKTYTTQKSFSDLIKGSKRIYRFQETRNFRLRRPGIFEP